MVDVLTREQRRYNMSMIRGTDTKPELLIRRALHAQGFRYRLHQRDLPGCPDIVLPRHHAVVFVHGCFWHGHHCHMVKKPATRTVFWENKIAGNVARDRRAIGSLQQEGWKVAIVWECAVRGRCRQPLRLLIRRLVRYIAGRKTSLLGLTGSDTE